MEQTATLKLNKPAKGTFDWDVPLNENWDKLDCLGAGQMPLLGQLIVDRKLTGAEATGWALQGSVLDGNVYKSVYNILSAARGRAVKETRTLKGATYTTYRDATTQLVFVDQSAYDAAFSALGDSIGYVINTSNKQIALPKRETFLRATVGKANLMEDESLPNIKGAMGRCIMDWKAYSASGAFADTDGGDYGATGAGLKRGNMNFNASRSSSAYKDGALVRPRHTTVYIYYRVGNTIVNQEQIDVGNLTNQVNSLNTNKANKDFSNVAGNFDFVIEKRYSGTEWYRKFKSGWIEQGGAYTNKTTPVITFVKPFSNTNYNFVAVPCIINGGSGSPAWREFSYSDKTTTSIKMLTTSPTLYTTWVACGQGV